MRRAPSTNASHLSLWQWAVAIALLLALFFQLTRAALRNSVTFDEAQHISRGYAYLTTGDLRFQRAREHPPGIGILEAAPLMLLPNMPDLALLQGWDEANTDVFAKELILKSPIIEPLLFAARAPVMLLTLLLAAFVFRWTSDLSRSKATFGLVALCLCVFDPNIIAHGMLTTNDLGGAASSFIALYWIWKSLQRPSVHKLVAAGLTLGLALTTKMTTVLLLPLALLLIFGIGMANRRTDYVRFVKWSTLRVRNTHLQRLLGLAVMAAIIYAIGFLIVWVIYRFEVGTLPGFFVPIPAATYLGSIFNTQRHMNVGHISFLMGQVSKKGWWYYFPIAFLIKTPIPTLIMLACGIIGSLWKDRRWLDALPIYLFVGVYAMITLFSTVDIGYRHLLPILPFIFVFIGSQTSHFTLPHRALHATRQHVARITFYALLAWYIVGTLSIFPNYLTFFNELVGGPKNGYKYLVDSNLDWGQSLVELRTFIAQNHTGRIKLSSNGLVNPKVYGIAYDPLPTMPNAQNIVRFDPSPGRYYIGAHKLQLGSALDHDAFGWFRERTPDEWIANAILVYNVPRRPAGQWVAQCAAPSPPLETSEIVEGFGRDNLRLIYFDCQTSWIYPASTPGWYILGHEAESVTLPDQLQREFRTSSLSRGAQFTLYRLETPPHLPDLATQVQAASGDTDTQGIPIQTPVNVGPLIFLGFTLDKEQVVPGQTLTLTTYWQVASGAGRLVSVLAHLVTTEGHVSASGDGLGVSVENWQPGDVIVQRHKLTIPQDTPVGIYKVQTGLYAFDDLSRFDIVSNSMTVGSRLLLAPIEVQ